MARRRAPGGSPGPDPPVDSVVEIRQNPGIDLKGSGLALLYDPAVLTDRTLATLRGRYRRAVAHAQASGAAQPEGGRWQSRSG